MQSPNDGPARAGSTPVRRNTASSILARFLPNQRVEHKMAAGKGTLSSLILTSPASHAAMDSSPINTAHSTEKPRSDHKAPITRRGSDEEVIIYDERSASVRRNSRPGRALAVTLKAPRAAKNPKSGPFHVDLDVDELSMPVSDRLAVRHEIATKTSNKRNRFLVENKNHFLPLLPANNHVKKLADKFAALTEQERAKLPSTTPFQEIELQPKGITATMKPYQLSGLSFMVWLYRNGMSGILGDEMGLGKTLQTISLIQYLKENEPKTGTQLRPFLIVCPLSVLSSWMSETKKWAPGLKVLRFHGPMKERDRLKRIALGEIDMYGNTTRKQKNKLKSRKTSSGKPVISLDSDEEDDEEEEQLGVDVVVTTYESYQAEQSWFKRAFVWRYVVLDEGHKIKNDLSLISKALQGLNAEYRLILTGTPLQNNLTELWALLHWLYPDVFPVQTSDLFRTSFDLGKGLYSNTVLDDSRHLLELIMLRRMKNSPGVDLNLPEKTEILLYVPLSPMQRFWYKRMITRADQGLLDELFKGAKDKEKAAMKGEADGTLADKDADLLDELSQEANGSNEWKESRRILAETIEREKQAPETGSNSTAWRKLMNLMMQLRKVCNHPYQIPNAEPEPYEVAEHIIHASGKFIVLEKLVSELVVKQKKKILIFSGFTRMLDLVEELMLMISQYGSLFRSVRLDGSTGRARRNLGIRMFNDTKSDIRVMLISTRAGGLGINLATASDVVLLDQDWNPQITLQAEARAHRIGQKNPVTVYKLVSQGTVEEQMMGRIQKKLYLSAKVTESMQDIHTKAGIKAKSKGGRGRQSMVDEDMPHLDTGQLMNLVRRGASALSKPEVDVNEMLSWDWEMTVAKCKDQPADINVKKDTVPDAQVDEEAEKKWLSEMERVESTVFDGKKLERGKSGASAREIAQEWNRADRRIGKNTTVMVDGFAINKESMLCKDWEAVPTMAGKDPRLAEPKRAKRAPVNNQDHCQVCLNGGEVHMCRLCPRSYHFECLDAEYKSKAKGHMFNCPQHQCADCEQKTTDAGGMLYRCRWCERAFCEDCLDFDKAVLLSDTLPEYELLQQPSVDQAYYVQCHVCTDAFKESPENEEVCERLIQEIDEEYERVFGHVDDLKEKLGVAPGEITKTAHVHKHESGDDSSSYVATEANTPREGSFGLTDATTIPTTGASTPAVFSTGGEDVEYLSLNPSRKRKAATASLQKIALIHENERPITRRSSSDSNLLEQMASSPATRNSKRPKTGMTVEDSIDVDSDASFVSTRSTRSTRSSTKPSGRVGSLREKVAIRSSPVRMTRTNSNLSRRSLG